MPVLTLPLASGIATARRTFVRPLILFLLRKSGSSSLELYGNFYPRKDFYIKMNKINTVGALPVTITTRVEDDLAEVIDEVAREEGMDRSTVIRRFLLKAVRNWRIDRSLSDYGAGRLTLWQAANKCSLSLWEMIDEVRKREIHVPYTLEELTEDLKTIQ